MCSPIAGIMSAMSAAAPYASVGIGAMSAMNQAKQYDYQAQTARDLAAYRSQVARNNALIANRAAEDALLRGKEKVRQDRLKKKALKGRQKSALANNNVVIDTAGSALDILDDTDAQANYDASLIKYNHEQEAYKKRMQAAGFMRDSEMALWEGNKRADQLSSRAKSTRMSGAYDAFEGIGKIIGSKKKRNSGLT